MKHQKPIQVVPGNVPPIISSDTEDYLTVDDNNCIPVSVGEWSLAYPPVNVWELLIAWKDATEYRKEYMKKILELPFVNNDQLKAI